MNCDSSNKLCSLWPLVNSFSLLLDVCQSLMQEYVYAAGVVTAYL